MGVFTVDNNSVIIGGQVFNKKIYNFLMTRFKESFSHASLSVEREFEKLDNCEASLNLIKNESVYEYYKLLEHKEKKDISAYLRRFVVFYGYRYGVLSGDFDVNCSQKKVDSIFYDNFSYMENDMLYVIKFDAEGNFLQRETFSSIGELFRLAFEKKAARDTAYNMQKDHMDAFDYAMSLGEGIGISDIIKINEKVNYTRPEKEIGFKKMNNIITGANFTVTDKVAVPTEMQRLLAEYKDNFGLEILDWNDPTISYKERNARLLKLFEKEAIFHIRFERIHPFSDGNGRTGRIIMNKHLIENGIAPVLITGVMTDEYKKYIGNFDYQGLAKMMLSSSSQLLSNWVSIRKAGIHTRKSDESNEKLAEVLVRTDKDSEKRKQKFRLSFWLF